MWCSQRLTFSFLNLSCTANETGLSHPRDSDGRLAKLRPLRSLGPGAHGADHGRCPTHFLLSLFFVNLIASIVYLVQRNPKADALALTSAEVGVVFCTVVLVTGPIWARPVWGIWWTWDLRLTLTLVLWLIYVSYLMLRRFSSSGQTPVMAGVLAVVGALDVPLVYFSIWFFRTQHPQPVIGGGGSIDPRMLHVLLVNWLAFTCFAALMCWSRYHLEILRRQVEETQALESLLASGSSR
jgi:heme exporter protein C